MVITAIEPAAADNIRTLCFADCAYLAEREENLRPFNYRRSSLLVEEGDQRLAGTKFEESIIGIECRIRTEGVGGNPDGFLILGRIGPESVLDAVSELTEDVLGDVGRTLGDEVDADALGTDKADDLLDLVNQSIWASSKKKTSFGRSISPTSGRVE